MPRQALKACWQAACGKGKRGSGERSGEERRKEELGGGDMRRAGMMFLALMTLAGVSCSTFAPVAVSTGDQCFRCRRMIFDRNVAAEMIDRDGFVSKYRGPGCLAKYLADHPDDTATVFATDYATGRMFSPSQLLFVPVVVDRATGESDYRAYRSKEDALASATQENTIPVDWRTVLERARS
jgi:hypothetical protein